MLISDKIFKIEVINEDVLKSDKYTLCFENNTFYLTTSHPVKYVKAYIKDNLSDYLIKADSFERSYGEIEYSYKKRILPWYFFAKKENVIKTYGVKTNPNSVCYFEVVDDYVVLTMDVRNGNGPVYLDGRTIELATLVNEEYLDKTTYEVEVDLCKRMVKTAIFPNFKIYGGNNWYYAYGKTSQKEIEEDILYTAKLAEGLENRPFFVIDDGYQKNECAGPWDELNERFYDMKALADLAKKNNVHPGIWLRPLVYKGNYPEEWILRPVLDIPDHDLHVLDFTVKEAMDYILNNLKTLVDWGYELIKYDYVTHDIYGVFAFDNNLECEPKYHFKDQSRTNAEIIMDLYKKIKETVGDTLLIGCNTMSHLIVGYAEIQRIGDDTSGKDFAVTKRMGVNVMGNRLSQNNIFYTVDGDCVGLTPLVPYEKNKQWMHLLAYSGSPMFISVKPNTVSKEIEEDIKKMYKVNSIQENISYPINEGDNKYITKWNIDGEIIEYNWD